MEGQKLEAEEEAFFDDVERLRDGDNL